jgi:hypothetical protein
MAKNSGMGLLVAGGAALLLLSGGKKKKKKTNGAVTPGPGIDETGDETDGSVRPTKRPFMDTGAKAEKMVFDKECKAVIENVDLSPGSPHDQWLTTRYYELREAGMDDPAEITLQLLMEQTEHCPWDDESRWTDFMRSTYNTLLNMGIRPYMNLPPAEAVEPGDLPQPQPEMPEMG